MTTTITGPDGAQIDFPDGISETEMNSAMAKAYPGPVPGGVGGAIANFGRGARMAIPFADRAIAGVEAIPHALGMGGDDYSTNLANSQAADQALQASHSIAGNLGQGTGAIVAGAPAALIAPGAGAGLLARAGAGAVQGGAIGGLQGASQSPDLSNLGQALANTSQGATQGAAIGGALPLAAGLAGKIPIPPPIKTLGDQFTRDVMNRGNVPGSNVSPPTLSAAQNTLGGGIGDVSGRNTLIHDPELTAGVQSAIDSQTTPNPGVQKYADDILGRSPSMPGADYAELRSDLTKKAFRLRMTDPDTSHAYGEMRDALDATMDRSIDANNPADSGVLAPLRQGYGNLQNIKTAASNPAPGADQSVLTPQAMQSALRGKGNSGSYAMGQGDLNTLTHSAVEGLQPPAPTNPLVDVLARGLGSHAGHALGAALGGGAGYATGGMPAAALGALGGAALPEVMGGVQSGRAMLGNTGLVKELAAQLKTPVTPYILSLARALAEQKATQ